jgi:transcription elongation factor GreA
MKGKNSYRLTPEGFQELKDELDKLIKARPALAEAIRVAREFGDLSENEEYSSRREDQARNEARIAELETIIASAEIIKDSSRNDQVVLGSRVVLRGNNKIKKEFQIVGTVEADPSEDKISDESPIGRELIGKKKGDKVVIKTAKDTFEYEIISIQ